MNDKARAQVHCLWDELSRFAAAEIDASCQYLLRTVGAWVGASHVGWLGTVRVTSGAMAKQDAMSGWRIRTVASLNPPSQRKASTVKLMLDDQADRPGMASIALARLAGAFRVHRLRDGFIDAKAFARTPHYQAYYKLHGVNDRLWVGSPISDDAESFFVFDKRHTAARFTKSDAQLAGYAIRGLTWFQRQLLCSHGLLAANCPLTPTERRVVQLLLTEKSEKEIAAEIGHSPHTTHGHIKEVFRKFGVQSRNGIVAIWLSNS